MRYPLPTQDRKLVQIIDTALRDSEWRSREWLQCKPGCTPCCIGVFAIDQLDVLRLQDGLAKLEGEDPERAGRLRQRAMQSWERLAPEFPGDARTGILDSDDEAAAAFEEFADYEACPVLDPERGTCDLYASRPVTCRVFGPPIRSNGGLGVCELCYHGASPDEVAGCEIRLEEAHELQAKLVEDLERSGIGGKTVVAYALARHSEGIG